MPTQLMQTPDIASTFADAPKAVLDNAMRVFRMYRDSGESLEESYSRTVRGIHREGWYHTLSGWKKIAPDIADKVDVHVAESQPDGRYVIQGVTVFYPNAVKGSDAAFDAARIRRATANTNTAIENGGQRPALTINHPGPFNESTESLGHGVNFRKSPRGEDWLECDLIDVPGHVVQDIRDRRYTGLSAGFVGDADDLNLRIGHIALLGVESQALSHLPMLEVFSSRHDSSLVFCADPVQMTKGPTMKIKNAEQRAKLFAALGTALTSYSVGEPNADHKVKEVFDTFGAHPDAKEDLKLLKSLFGAEEEGEDKDIEDILGEDFNDAEDDDDDEDDYSAEQEAQELTDIPDATKDNGDDDPEEGIDIPSGNKTTEKQFSALRESNYELQDQVRGLIASNRKKDFSAVLQRLTVAGHQFSAATAMDTFISGGMTNSAAKSVVDLVKSTPRTGKALDTEGATFSAGNDRPARTKGPNVTDNKQTLRALNRAVPSMNFSAADVDLGEKLSNLFPDDDQE